MKGLAVLAGLLALASCGRLERKGELMVAVTSQMPVPKDIATVSIEVRSQHTRRAYRSFKTDPDATSGLPLPATLAVIAGSSPGEPVVIRVGAWDRGGILRVVRTVTTTVPQNRIALLPVELEWLCYDQVRAVKESDVESHDGDDSDPNDPYALRSACNAGETCTAGRCVSDVVDSSQLPDFVKDELDRASDGAGCLDVLACFATASRLFPPSDSSCRIDRLQGGSGINIGLELPPGSPGFCDAERCVVPLSGFSEAGWTENGASLQLAPRICELLKSGSVRGLLGTTSCPAKTPSVAACRTGGSSMSTDAGR